MHEPIGPVGRLHDASSRLLFQVAGLALSLAVALYLFEVMTRYFFNAPTAWSGEAVRYSLAVLIFLGLPEVTRNSAHIAIDIVPEMLPPRIAAGLHRACDLLAALTCGAAAWIAGAEALKQFSRGLMTNATYPIPRWLITGVIAFGLASAALHFIRHLAARR